MIRKNSAVAIVAVSEMVLQVRDVPTRRIAYGNEMHTKHFNLCEKRVEVPVVASRR